MPSARTVIKFSVIGFLAVVASFIVLITTIHMWNWPIPVCKGHIVMELPSPSKAMAALYLQEKCDSMGRDSEMQAKVFIGTDVRKSRQLVFSAPANYRDGQGQEHSIVLEMIWKSEDQFEIAYPNEIAPTLAGTSIKRENFVVEVTSRPRMTPNPSLQPDRKSAAELQR